MLLKIQFLFDIIKEVIDFRRRDMIMDKEKKLVVNFTEEELQMIYDVFDELTTENLCKWTTLIQTKEAYKRTECFQHWLTTGMFDIVRLKAKNALEMEVSASKEKENILKI